MRAFGIFQLSTNGSLTCFYTPEYPTSVLHDQFLNDAGSNLRRYGSQSLQDTVPTSS